MPAPVTPLLTVDVVIEVKQGIVLIERKNRPFGWALPGGFVDVGETVEHAAKREAKEETGLTVRNLKLLGVYSDPKRDARGHTVSAVFVGRASGVPKGADDAKRAIVADPGHPPRPLAFDHARILKDYRASRRGRRA